MNLGEERTGILLVMMVQGRKVDDPELKKGKAGTNRSMGHSRSELALEGERAGLTGQEEGAAA